MSKSRLNRANGLRLAFTAMIGTTFLATSVPALAQEEEDNGYDIQIIRAGPERGRSARRQAADRLSRAFPARRSAEHEPAASDVGQRGRAKLAGRSRDQGTTHAQRGVESAWRNRRSGRRRWQAAAAFRARKGQGQTRCCGRSGHRIPQRISERARRRRTCSRSSPRPSAVAARRKKARRSRRSRRAPACLSRRRATRRLRQPMRMASARRTTSRPRRTTRRRTANSSGKLLYDGGAA